MKRWCSVSRPCSASYKTLGEALIRRSASAASLCGFLTPAISGDMSDDDADAMGGGAGGGGAGGGMAAPQGTPADSVGAALKAALDILNADQSHEMHAEMLRLEHRLLGDT